VFPSNAQAELPIPYTRRLLKMNAPDRFNQAVKDIQIAFQGRTKPTRSELLDEAFGDEDEVRSFLSHTWEELALDHSKADFMSLPLLGEEGISYFLPAAMIMVLSNTRSDVDTLETAIVSMLDPNNNFVPFTLPSHFNESERKAIGTFLREVVNRNVGMEFPIEVSKSCFNIWTNQSNFENILP
jgi:hypothetical protein